MGDMPVVMEVTVLDTAMVDTVARDPLKPGVYMDVAMEDMVDTPVDTVMWIRPWIRLWWIRMVNISNPTHQRNHFIQNFAISTTAETSEHILPKNKCQPLLTKTI